MIESLYGMQIMYITSTDALFFEKYMPRTLRDPKKDEFLDFEQGSISITSYEAKYHSISRYATQWDTTRNERIW